MREPIEVRTSKGREQTARRVAGLLRRHGYDVLTMGDPLPVHKQTDATEQNITQHDHPTFVGPEKIQLVSGFTDDFTSDEMEVASHDQTQLKFPTDVSFGRHEGTLGKSAVDLQVILRASDCSLALCLRLVELLVDPQQNDAPQTDTHKSDSHADPLVVSSQFQHAEQITNHLLRLKDSLSAIEGLLGEMNLLHHEIDQDLPRPRGA